MLTIKTKCPKECRFSEIKPGEVFKYKGYFYLAINNLNNETINIETKSKVNAIQLTHFYPYTFLENDFVFPVKETVLNVVE